MLVLASKDRIDSQIRLSIEEDNPVPKDSFYIKLPTAHLDSFDKTILKKDCYLILPRELITIIDGANVITIKGYRLRGSEASSTVTILEAIQDTSSDDADIICNHKIFLDIEKSYLITCDLSNDWILIWNEGKLQLKSDCVTYSEDVEPEYVGTPAECRRWTIPAALEQPANHD